MCQRCSQRPFLRRSLRQTKLLSQDSLVSRNIIVTKTLTHFLTNQHRGTGIDPSLNSAHFRRYTWQASHSRTAHYAVYGDNTQIDSHF